MRAMPSTQWCFSSISGSGEAAIVVGSQGTRRSHLRDWGMLNVYEIYLVWRHRFVRGVTCVTELVFGLQLPRFVPV